MIRLTDIEKSYPIASGRVYVLRRVSLEVKEGDFVTTMGPSGAGKSTLLAILGMLDADWTGEYELLGDGNRIVHLRDGWVDREETVQ